MITEGIVNNLPSSYKHDNESNYLKPGLKTVTHQCSYSSWRI